MEELLQSSENLIGRYQAWARSLQRQEGVSVIHADEVATAVASFYEKLRGVINWREEHLLRKSAIERALRRRIMLKKRGEKIAESLVLDLIRGGHFPNDAIPEAKIGEVQKSLDKYVFLLDNAPGPKNDERKNRFSKWIFSVAACEIEAILAPSIREEALMDYMEGIMKERIRLNEGAFATKKMGEEEKDVQVFIAVRRALFKLDTPTITLHLLKRRYPDWPNLSGAFLEETTKNIHQIHYDIERELHHHLAEKFYKVCEKYDAPFLILSDIISKNPAGARKALMDTAALKDTIDQAYEERSKKVKARTRRAAIYSTISIFLSKVFLVLTLEIPIDKYITGEFNMAALGINVLVPPLLMFLMVATVMPPGKANLERVTAEIMKIVYPSRKKEAYEIAVPPKRGLPFRAFIDGVYFLTYFVSFGAIALLLSALNFGVLSIVIFLLFFCLITFAGVRIRGRAKELELEEEKKEGFFHSLGDWLVLPIIRGGRWLSSEWEKHNAIAALFNSLIDMPFQTFVEFLEQWRHFLREKKQEIQ